jgi:hypothetical protein
MQELKMSSVSKMLRDLPKACDAGTQVDSKGYKHSWRGYKLHVDTAEGEIPIACILTSASMRDSQAAIPLATITAGRVTSCYDVMDIEIKLHAFCENSLWANKPKTNCLWGYRAPLFIYSRTF